ncbi:MAG: type II toxin-antitoxin system PemK/MazF family toxin [Kofleriaceae bacterium]|nr:type II toxin-antitoxin system PemK/MazF family toxin [Candidatus Methylomirabilis lanthanidiphila]
MSFPRRGEIYLVRLPGHPSDSKARPALVVSMDVRNRLANDVIVVPLSTTHRPAPTHVELPAGEGGLQNISMAKCEQVTTLDKAFLLRGPFAGIISPPLMRDIERAVQIAIGILP